MKTTKKYVSISKSDDRAYVVTIKGTQVFQGIINLNIGDLLLVRHRLEQEIKKHTFDDKQEKK